MARKLRDTQTELRVFNKLAELQIGLHNYENALEFATLAVRLSVDVGRKESRFITQEYSIHFLKIVNDW